MEGGEHPRMNSQLSALLRMTELPNQTIVSTEKKRGQGYFSLVWICHPCESGLESLTCFSVLREAILCPVFP